MRWRSMGELLRFRLLHRRFRTSQGCGTCDSLWFEVAVVSSIFAFGSIFFGHFEERTPRWRKVLKLLLFIAVVTALSAFLGRTWAFAIPGAGLARSCRHSCRLASQQGDQRMDGRAERQVLRARGWSRQKYPDGSAAKLHRRLRQDIRQRPHRYHRRPLGRRVGAGAVGAEHHAGNAGVLEDRAVGPERLAAAGRLAAERLAWRRGRASPRSARSPQPRTDRGSAPARRSPGNRDRRRRSRR